MRSRQRPQRHWPRWARAFLPAPPRRRPGGAPPGWYRYTVGDLEVTVVTDGARAFDLTPSYVTNAPIEEVRKALEAAYMPPNRLIHHYAPIVINTGGKLVVIDTGGGPGAYKESKGEHRPVRRKSGRRPASIRSRSTWW